ncbi:MAG: VWA domain-containing protein, partial [Thermoanaerobaculia bacterium]|nr:VWA domain-containing protein [Thermoanaerobaculia bacterium]
MGTFLASDPDVHSHRRSRVRLAPLSALLLLLAAALAGPLWAKSDPLTWSPEQQAFWFDGPAWLMPSADRDAFAALDDEERDRAMADFLEGSGVDAEVFATAIERRRELMFDGDLSSLDERGKLLFLNGAPSRRQVIDCAEAFKPLEIWRYGASDPLILYKPDANSVYRLWLPLESKKVLYTQELEFWLEEWEIFKGRIRGKRIDRLLCPEAELVDTVTGIDGLVGSKKDKTDKQPLSKDLLKWLDPPTDLAAWAQRAQSAKIAPAVDALPIPEVSEHFPQRAGLRMRTQIFVTLPGDSAIVPFVDGEHSELRLSVEGVVESGDEVFDRFRLRYVMEPPAEGVPVLLAVQRDLRPGKRVRVRLRIFDEVGEGETTTVFSFEVPREPDPLEAELAAVAMAPNTKLDQQLETGPNGLVLLVPPREIVFGNLRAQAVVRGERIDRVTFLVDDKPQLTKRAEPWAVDLIIPNIPRELTVSAQGFDAEGELVAEDEVVLNQPRGELSVQVVEPPRGASPRGNFLARARVVVPEGRRVERLEFQVNNEVVATVTVPPWETRLTMPDTGELAYLTAVAYLDDESRAEDVRFLNAPYEMSEVDVQLVELYTTVLGRGGGIVRDLDVGDFVVKEDGREQTVEKFELVTDLPLTVGITMDTSGSMIASLGEAQRAAVEFLERVVDPQDQCFAVGFSDEPHLIMPRTQDVGAVALTLEGLRANGWTALHDAVVFSLYYFSDVHGRRVLVLLSDGDDTDSRLEYADVLEYARQSSVVIYTIGLKNESLDTKARRKLAQLAEETGGRSFLIDRAEELSAVYSQIEEELRSQYLIAYNSDSKSPIGTYRLIEVDVKKRGNRART